MSIRYTLEFEKPLAEIEAKISALEAIAKVAAPSNGIAPIADPTMSAADASKELAALRKQQQQALKKVYANLSPWDTVRVARHPKRPQFRDYASMICKEFVELHGDRRYGDDPAIVTGFGR
ncbi:MAG: acetyl-CoA carboxylase carboxyl transferase subunit alpha, partial [Phycisphaerae bacterium]|nr:acetyl-CoA carboxylase carboxyl transferase subunit alpha [Phycisphaerae bacterium]